MPTKAERIIGICERLIASGRTRLLVALAGISALAFAGWIDRPNVLYYAGGIIIIVIVFILAKTFSDVKEGPAQHGACEKTDEEKNSQSTPD